MLLSETVKKKDSDQAVFRGTKILVIPIKHVMARIYLREPRVARNLLPSNH